jgi:rRNA maturation protein Nop10
MSQLKKCDKCYEYTLKEVCPKCKEKTKDAHYKFVKLKDIKEN